MAKTPEFMTLLQCEHKLRATLSNDPLDYANHLLAATIISSNDHDKMLLSSCTPTEKATVLVSAVKERIQSDSGRFKDFLQILSKNESTKDLVKTLVRKCEGQS